MHVCHPSIIVGVGDRGKSLRQIHRGVRGERERIDKTMKKKKPELESSGSRDVAQCLHRHQPCVYKVKGLLATTTKEMSE